MRNYISIQNDKWVKEFNEHKNEGCRVYGTVKVAKVAGNFHLAPGDPHQAMRSHGKLLVEVQKLLKGAG